VIELAVEDIELIGSQLDLTDEPGTNAYCTFTAERLLHCFKETGFRLEVFDDLLSVLTVHEYGRVLFNLRQELFRAWKRKYPNDESKYETLLDTGDDEAVSKALPWLAPPNTDRPCAPRDYQFFLWSLEGMGPAKIRDRWDGMSDEERKRISPKCWNRIGEASKRQGAQTAKQGVKRAKADLGLEQCGVNELRRRLREPG
jgi:hypothetical protein